MTNDSVSTESSDLAPPAHGAEPARPAGVDLGKAGPSPGGLVDIDPGDGPAAMPPPGAISTATPLYFPVSAFKLVVMSLCTLGLYDLYVFYKNWELIRARQRPDILPFWRAFFSIFFVYDLFRWIDADAERLGVPKASAGPMAAGWIVFRLLGRVLSRLLVAPYWLVSLLGIGFMVPVQNTVNRVNAQVAPGHDPNARFTGWNIAWMVGGVLLLGLIVLGSLVPDEAGRGDPADAPASRSPLGQVLLG